MPHHLHMNESRYYQIDATIASQERLKCGVKTQMVVAATGTGKSKIGTDIAKPFKSVLWLAHNIELIEQSSINLLSEELNYTKEFLESEIKARGGLISLLKSKEADSFSDEIKANLGIVKEDLLITDKRITVASVQTIWRRLNQIPYNAFDIVVVDECHHAGATTWSMTLNHFKPELRIGFTATPWRAADDMTLDDLFEEIVYEYPIAKGIQDGHLCKPDAIKVKTSASLDKVNTSGSDFNQKELSERVNTLERNNLIVNKYIEYAKGRPFIAFCCNVEHTIDLCEAFNEKGVKSSYVVGDKDLTRDRKGIINAFKSQDFINGEAEGLINCMIATEGFDMVNVGCVILACPTKSRTKFYQTIGRGLRKKTKEFVDKFGQNCIILDVVDNTTKHRLVNCENEDALLPLEEKLFISDINRQKIRDAIAKREQMVNVVARDKDEIIELFPLPKPPKFKMTARHLEPATEEQLKGIQRFGYPIENVSYTKWQIQQIFLSQMAGKNDVDDVAKAGFDVSNGVTLLEVSLVKQSLLNKVKK